MLLAAGIVLVGFNVRIAVASVPPLLPDLEHHLAMSSTVGGLLTSLPYACFAVLAPGAPLLTRRLGAESTLAVVVAAMGAGALLRTAGSATALFAGTAAAGAGIAVANVLVPAIVKQRFATRVGALMGVYTAVLSIGAGAAGGLTVPASDALGWQGALAMWAAPAAVSLIPILAAARGASSRPTARGRARMRTLLGNALAWHVTLFFGLQAAVVFSALSWLPSILRADGYGAGTAGVLLAVFAVGGVPASLAAPALATRMRDQRPLAVGAAVMEALAAAGLAAFPGAAPAWVALFALGQGASFSLALTLIVLRSPDARGAAELSAMAQAIGYSIAAAGPFAVGALHAGLGGWTPPLLLLVALCAPMAAAGAGAGRSRVLPARPRSHAPRASPLDRAR